MNNMESRRRKEMRIEWLVPLTRFPLDNNGQCEVKVFEAVINHWQPRFYKLIENDYSWQNIDFKLIWLTACSAFQ